MSDYTDEELLELMRWLERQLDQVLEELASRDRWEQYVDYHS